jgi:hypothetical protein
MHASVQTVLNALCRPRAQLRILAISEIITILAISEINTNRVALCSTLSLCRQANSCCTLHARCPRYVYSQHACESDSLDSR